MEFKQKSCNLWLKKYAESYKNLLTTSYAYALEVVEV
jgi:hypothetical protein